MKITMILAVTLVAFPIIFALAVYPDTFELNWNQGRGGALFALAFVVAELAMLRVDVSVRQLVWCMPITLVGVVYMILAANGLHTIIGNYGTSIGIELTVSWIWMWDLAVITILMMVTLYRLLGMRWVRLTPAGPIFLGGSAMILGLDAHFPYDSLGPLQYVVPYMVELNVWLVTVFDIGVATARDNIMFLSGDYGRFVLQVFWPSAGVHSIIIYSLVMMAFLLKMRIFAHRKAMWFAIGIVGTIIVNIIRIFLLSWYALKVTTDAQKWEEFHSIAGEIMFLPWLFGFIILVMVIESRRIRKSDLRA